MKNLCSFFSIFLVITHQTVADIDKWAQLADAVSEGRAKELEATTTYVPQTQSNNRPERWGTLDAWTRSGQRDVARASPSPDGFHQIKAWYRTDPNSSPVVGIDYTADDLKEPCNWCLRPQCKPGACQTAPNFDAKADAEKLKKAMAGLGTKEQVLFDILINRSEEQIELIKQAYLGLGKKSLKDDIKKETSFNVEDLLVALLKPRAEFFADELYKAFKKLDDKAMIMILTSLPPCAIREISSIYYKKRGKTLVKAVRGATVLKFEEFLEEIVKTNRAAEGRVNNALAKNDAKALWMAGAYSWIKKKRVFIYIFTHRSFGHIREVKEHYNKLFFKPNFDKNIKKHSGGGKLTRGLVAMLENIEDQPHYFADEIEGALDHLIVKGKLDSSVMIRILRGRCGIDLGDIVEAYPKSHDGKSLEDAIKEKRFLHFEQPLLQLITPQKVN